MAEELVPEATPALGRCSTIALAVCPDRVWISNLFPSKCSWLVEARYLDLEDQILRQAQRRWELQSHLQELACKLPEALAGASWNLKIYSSLTIGWMHGRAELLMAHANGA